MTGWAIVARPIEVPFAVEGDASHWKTHSIRRRKRVEHSFFPTAIRLRAQFEYLAVDGAKLRISRAVKIARAIPGQVCVRASLARTIAAEDINHTEAPCPVRAL